MEKLTDVLVDSGKFVIKALVELGLSGMPGWITGGVILVVLGVGGFFLWKWFRDKKRKQAAEQNERNRLSGEQQIPISQSLIEKDARESTQTIRQRMTRKQARDLLVVKTDVECPSHGSFRTLSHEPKGVVIHYTAGRPIMDIHDAERQMEDLAKRGFGTLLIGVDGTIYAPKNWTGKEVFLHAGASHWLTERDLSRVAVGLEVSCAGKLDELSSETWWGAAMPDSDVRAIPKDRANIKKGLYHKFTVAQERSIVNFCRALHMSSPDFDVRFVIGHDECSPDRKSDPGGSLSVTMPDFRAILANAFGISDNDSKGESQ